MNQVLIIHYAHTYLNIKKRGAIWVQGFNGKWHSDFKNPLTKFLLRFDEVVAARIMIAVRALSPTPRRRPTVEELIEDA